MKRMNDRLGERTIIIITLMNGACTPSTTSVGFLGVIALQLPHEPCESCPFSSCILWLRVKRAILMYLQGVNMTREVH